MMLDDPASHVRVTPALLVPKRADELACAAGAMFSERYKRKQQRKLISTKHDEVEAAVGVVAKRVKIDSDSCAKKVLRSEFQLNPRDDPTVEVFTWETFDSYSSES